MGKKKKAQRGQKEKRVAVASPQSTPQTDENGVIPVPKGRKVCSHLEKGIDLDKLTSKFNSAEPVKCEDCREGALDRRAAKSGSKSKSGKKKSGGGGGQSKSDSKSVWVCLECGHFSCGGVGFPTTPQSHALRHSRQFRHPLAVKLENPSLRWCFPCSSPIPVFENEEQKDLLPDIIKIIKSKPVETNAVDIENLWFGTGSILGQEKAEATDSSELGGGYVVRGLSNLGNTCFFNSVMQNLLAMDKVRDYILKLDRSVGPLTVSLKKLFVETNSSSGARGVVNPKSFFGCLCTKFPQFSGNQQHDSHELLRCLQDSLCSEELSERKELNLNSSKENGGPLDLEPTFVDNIFGGKLSSTVRCLKCGHSSVVYEPYLDLSLSVPTKKPPTKKTQPVLKGKKPKLPPKRTGRIRPKLNRDTAVQSTSTAEAENLASASVNIAPLDLQAFEDKKLVESTLLSLQGIESDKLVENVEVESETPTWLDFIGPGTISDDDEIGTMNIVENAEVETETKNIVENAEVETETKNIVENAEVEFEFTPYLDIDYSITTNGNDTSNDSVIRDNSFDTSEPACSSSANEKAELPKDLSGDFNETGKFSVEIEDSSLTQDSVAQDPNNNRTPNNDSASSSEEPRQVQDSEIILLPYKEEEKIDCPVEQDTADLEGLGDLFNEPDDVPVMGPAMRPSDTSYTAGTSSGSDPDEVDNSNTPVSVESCLAHFTKSELLADEHAWHCEGCSKSAAIHRRRSKKKSANSADDGSLSCNGDSCSVNNGDDDHDNNHEDGDDDDDDNEMADSEDVKVKRDATKTLLIDKSPPILTVHLKRFLQDPRGRLSKLKGHVAFKEVFDLRPYMNPSFTVKEKYKYRLLGVVEHSGSMRGGHYIAYIRGGPKKKTAKTDQTKKTDDEEEKESRDCSPSPSIWYHVSDAYVREASFEEVLKCEAYILFYEEI